MRPYSRQELKDYCLRRLGYPVIQINVDDAQVEDRLDDALQYFSEYHFDGVERVYLLKQVTQTDIDRKYIDLKDPVLEDTALGLKAAPALDPDGRSVVSVVRVFQLFDTLGGTGMFDARYQIALNDLYGLRTNTYSDSLISYDITRRHMQMLQDMLTPEKTLEFSRVTNRIYVNMDWKTQTKIGEYLLFEAYKILDPNIYTEIYNDWLLKKYCTAIIKFQWGQNLSKYSGVALPGGVTMDASSIISEARQEMQQIEEQIQSKYELPPEFMVG
jgi:hypothetical protein